MECEFKRAEGNLREFVCKKIAHDIKVSNIYRVHGHRLDQHLHVVVVLIHAELEVGFRGRLDVESV